MYLMLYIMKLQEHCRKYAHGDIALFASGITVVLEENIELHCWIRPTSLGPNITTAQKKLRLSTDQERRRPLGLQCGSRRGNKYLLDVAGMYTIVVKKTKDNMKAYCTLYVRGREGSLSKETFMGIWSPALDTNVLTQRFYRRT